MTSVVDCVGIHNRIATYLRSIRQARWVENNVRWLKTTYVANKHAQTSHYVDLMTYFHCKRFVLTWREAQIIIHYYDYDYYDYDDDYYYYYYYYYGADDDDDDDDDDDY